MRSRIDGARSATTDVQNEGHAVDVDVGQLKVEVVELELEIDVDADKVVLDDALSVELAADDGIDDESVLEVDRVVDNPAVEVDEGEDIVVDADEVVIDAELTGPDVDDDCAVQDACDGFAPAKYTFKRLDPPQTSAVFPLHGM